MDKRGLIFVVAAPSGAGKTSLCKALMQRIRQAGDQDLFWSCSYTTRPPRKGEEHGRDYFFVDDKTFDRMVAAHEFAEWAGLHGNRYGTSRSYLEESVAAGRDLLLEIDIQGARQLREKYDKACFVFILPPSWEELGNRLKGRNTEPGPEIERRLARAKEEMLEWSWFDYIIINSEFEGAVDRLRSVVLSARSRREVMSPEVEAILADLGEKR